MASYALLDASKKSFQTEICLGSCLRQNEESREDNVRLRQKDNCEVKEKVRNIPNADEAVEKGHGDWLRL